MTLLLYNERPNADLGSLDTSTYHGLRGENNSVALFYVVSFSLYMPSSPGIRIMCWLPSLAGNAYGQLPAALPQETSSLLWMERIQRKEKKNGPNQCHPIP